MNAPIPSNDDRSGDDGPLADEQRERLVAYLDGELPADESRAIESQLADDASVRSELQRLDRVWNALDELPRTTVDDNFTQSTVEMIVADAHREVQHLTTVMPAQRRRRSRGAVVVCVVAMLVGSLFAYRMATRHDRQLLAALPVVYQIDTIGQFHDAEFLRRLRADASRLVAEFEQREHQGRGVAQRADDWGRLVEGSHADRSRWVAEQDDAEKLRLQRAARRYADSTPATRDAAASVLADLRSQPDAAELYRVAIAYQAWLATQPPTTQARLRQMEDPAERVAEIKQLYRSDRARAKRTLTDEEAGVLRSAIKDLAGDPSVEQLRQAGAERLRELAPSRGKGRPPRGFAGRFFVEQRRLFEARSKKFPAGLVFAIADLAVIKSDRTSKFFRQVFRDEYPQIVDQAEEAWPRLEERLLRDLSPAKRKQLGGMKPAQRVNRLRSWVQEAAKEVFRPDGATLEAFFASDALTDDERGRLLALPTEEMKRELQRRYVEHQVGFSLREGPHRREGPRRRPRPDRP